MIGSVLFFQRGGQNRWDVLGDMEVGEVRTGKKVIHCQVFLLAMRTKGWGTGTVGRIEYDLF